MLRNNLQAAICVDNRDLIYLSRKKISGKRSAEQVMEVIQKKLPDSIIENGRIIRPELLEKSLLELKLEVCHKPGRINLIISDNNVFARSFEFPLLNKKGLEECIYLEAERFLPYKIQEAVVDYSLLATGETGYSVYVVAVPRNLVRSYCQILGKYFPSLHRITVRGESIWLLLKNILGGQEILLLENYEHDIFITAGGADKIYFSQNIKKDNQRDRGGVTALEVVQSADEYLSKEFKKEPIKKVLWWSADSNGLDRLPREDFVRGHCWRRLDWKQLNIAAEEELLSEKIMRNINSSNLLPVLGLLSCA